MRKTFDIIVSFEEAQKKKNQLKKQESFVIYENLSTKNTLNKRFAKEHFSIELYLYLIVYFCRYLCIFVPTFLFP